MVCMATWVSNEHHCNSKESSSMFPLKDVDATAPYRNQTYPGEEWIHRGSTYLFFFFFHCNTPSLTLGRALNSLLSFHSQQGHETIPKLTDKNLSLKVVFRLRSTS